MTAVLSSITERCIPKTKAVLNVFSQLTHLITDTQRDCHRNQHSFIYYLKSCLYLAFWGFVVLLEFVVAVFITFSKFQSQM